MAQTKTLLQAITAALKPMGMKMYLFERPSAVLEGQSSFLVVSLPGTITNQIVGEDGSVGEDDFDWSDATLTIEIFVKDDVKASNPDEVSINAVNTYTEQLKGLFPIADLTRGVEAVKPKVVIPAHSDGNGFHYTRVHARISTMF